jgi:hypothetical protein
MPACRTVCLLVLACAMPPGALAAAPSCEPAHAMNPALKPLVDAAIADLSQRLRTPAADVCVVEARTVVWPDRSIGCPQPGLQYPQVQQDGVFIRLRVQDRTYAYHGGGSRAPFLCDLPERRDPPPSGGGAGSGRG